jgi:hypothetical protein
MSLKWSFFLLGIFVVTTITNHAEAKPIKWRFMLIEGRNGDAGFDQKKTLCVPYEDGFIMRMPASGDPQFSDDFLQNDEHIRPESLTVSDVGPPQTTTCEFHAEKQDPTPGMRCVIFWIHPGPAGAQVCEGQWELRVLTDK